MEILPLDFTVLDRHIEDMEKVKKEFVSKHGEQAWVDLQYALLAAGMRRVVRVMNEYGVVDALRNR